MGRESEYHFNPEGKLWEVNGERLTVLGGGRALLLQLAHPLVAQGVYDAGFLQRNPQKRLLNTLGAGLNLIFGTEEQVEGIRRRINSVHSKVKGPLTEQVGSYVKGRTYDATDLDQLKWVAATIIDSSLKGFETLVRPLSDNEKDDYLKEATELFSLLNVDTETFPRTYVELNNYACCTIASV